MKLGKQFEKYAQDPVKTIERKLSKPQVAELKEWARKIIYEVDDEEWPAILIDHLYSIASDMADREANEKVDAKILAIKRTIKNQFKIIKGSCELVIKKIEDEL